jgi:hypothetical protein
MRRLREVRGLRFDDLTAIVQRPIELPKYIPVIDHPYVRSTPLDWPVVALDTYKVLRLKNGRYQAIAKNAADLRRAFCLASTTKIILRGVAKDPNLERYWSYRRYENVPEQLARLDISLAVGPNFSHFLDVPRPDNLFNRKRQLICLEEFSQAGIAPVPHLSTSGHSDWTFWKSYLIENATITYVAAEFQTGNNNVHEGQKKIDEIARLRDSIGRSLHPLIIGGARFVKCVSRRFKTFSIIDSSVFMKALHRQLFDGSAGHDSWRDIRTPKGQHLDDVLSANLRNYAKWISQRSVLSRQEPT